MTRQKGKPSLLTRRVGPTWFGLTLARFLAVSVLLSFAVLLPTTPITLSLDRILSDWRFAQFPRQTSDRFVFIAIDKASLDAVGVWPWPRHIHAEAIDRLIAAGAHDVFLDIDFSVPSNAEDDRRLEQALERAGGGVLLPMFVQPSTSGERGTQLAVNKPLPALERNAWLAGANVMPDEDGVVRSLPLTENADREQVQSVSALLAGAAPAGEGSAFLLDFSISPDNLAVYSFNDLRTGKIGAAELAGRSVIVGASAVELKDFFTVPVHGIISGPVLHILGAETLLQQRVMQSLDGRTVAVALTVLLLCLMAALTRRAIVTTLLSVLTFSVAIEAAALFLQVHHHFILPTASSQSIIICSTVFYLLDRLNLSQVVVALANRRAHDVQRVLHHVINDSADAILVFNEQRTVRQMNSAAERILGQERLSALNRDVDHALPFLAQAFDQLSGEEPADVRSIPVEMDVNGRSLEGTMTRSRLGDDPDSDVVFCLTLRDVTQRKAHEQQLRDLSQFDMLTRTLRRDELLRRAAGQPALAAFVINLQRFAPINAVFGRDVGDALLVQVARRLGEIVPKSSLVARTDGDGFAVLLLEWPNGVFDEKASESLVSQLSEVYKIGETAIEIGFGLGFSTLSGENGAQLLKEAESALEPVRRSTRKSCNRYDPSVSQREARTRELELDMKLGLSRGEFFLLYQPQVDLLTGAVTGAEALVRWRHPRYGIVPPGDFISIAEANGFISELGQWVLQTACREASTWPSRLAVSVNIAPLQFQKNNMSALIMRTLDECGLDAARLHIEVTESGFMDASEDLLVQFARIRALGVKIALDDFGTGFSSLQYLVQFPLDKLKVDQSFVRLLGTHSTARTIVSSIRSLAVSLGASVVCEGIETVEQSAILADMGCEEGQGYLYGRPQSPTDFLLTAQMDRREFERLAG